MCKRCGEKPDVADHSPCCDKHRKAMCCACYRRTHFVSPEHVGLPVPCHP